MGAGPATSADAGSAPDSRSYSDIARRAALRELLTGWERSVGPVGTDEASAAAAAFDELQGEGPCCAQFSSGLVIASDPDDIMHLAAAVPAARILTRSPD